MNATNDSADHLAGREPVGLGRNQAPDSVARHGRPASVHTGILPREGQSGSRASCRRWVRGCAPQLPPRPGAAARFASRPERPASRLPAQPRPVLSPMRVSGPTCFGAREPTQPFYPDNPGDQVDLGRYSPTGGRKASKIFETRRDNRAKRTPIVWQSPTGTPARRQVSGISVFPCSPAAAHPPGTIGRRGGAVRVESRE